MSRLFSNPIPGVSLGDPFVLRSRGWFYLYGTNEGPSALGDGRAIPVYRSIDLIAWESLGGALVPTDPTADHRAPEVLEWNGRFYMVVSFGDVDRKGHRLWVAVSDDPAGPFELRACLNRPEEKFSIDGAWLLDDDGRLYLYRCLDFVGEGDMPHGTGIVVQPMADPLTPSGPPATVLRAHSEWQRFETNRRMPLYENRTFAEWTTIEGPAPIKRAGRYYCGYSGGNFTGAYGTGEAVASDPLGPYVDLRGGEGPLFGTTPGLVEGPGHLSVIQPDLISDWIVLHGRPPGGGPRRVWLCPASWGEQGVEIGELTDRPQAAPALPAIHWRAGDPIDPHAWAGRGRLISGEDGLTLSPAAGSTQDDDAEALDSLAQWNAPLSSDGLAMDVWVRLDDPGSRAGLIFSPADAEDLDDLCIYLSGDAIHAQGPGGYAITGSLPTLGGSPFEPNRFHRLAVRVVGDEMQTYVDGVIVLSLPVTSGSVFAGVVAGRIATFDGLSIASRA